MSSFLLDLLGNVAEQTQAGIAESRARDRKLEDEQRAEDNAITRAQKLAEMKQSVDEQARQRLMERTSQQMQQAEEGGAELTAAQRLKELQGANVGDVSTLTPEQEAMIAKGHGLKYNTSLSQLDNQLTAARKGGLYEAESQLAQARKETLAALVAESKDRSQQVRDDVLMRNSDTAAKNAETNALRVEALINKGLAGGGARVGNTTFDRQVALLRQAGRTDAQIADFITNKKMPTDAEIVNGLLKSDPNKGTKKAMTVDQARSLAQEILGASTPQAPAAPAGQAPAQGKYPGFSAKQIGGK